jgi:hypothetical protein
MKIETKRHDAPVHVIPCKQEIRLGIGKVQGDGYRFAVLSLAQAEMLLHALGLAVAEIKEQQCRQAEKAALAPTGLDREFRRPEPMRPE